MIWFFLNIHIDELCHFHTDRTILIIILKREHVFRGRSKTAATSKVELFVIIVNGFQPLTIITKSSTLDVAAALYPPLGKVKHELRLASYELPVYIYESRVQPHNLHWACHELPV